MTRLIFATSRFRGATDWLRMPEALIPDVRRLMLNKFPAYDDHIGIRH